MVYFVKENGLDILCVSLQLPMLLIAAFPLVVFQKTKKTLKTRYCTIINLLHLKTMLLFFQNRSVRIQKSLLLLFNGPTGNLWCFLISLASWCFLAALWNCCRLHTPVEFSVPSKWQRTDLSSLNSLWFALFAATASLLQCGLACATFYCHHS